MLILTLLKPARNVAQLYGLCLNAWDGRLRLVLELCDHGNVREYVQTLPRDMVRAVTPVARCECVLCKQESNNLNLNLQSSGGGIYRALVHVKLCRNQLCSSECCIGVTRVVVAPFKFVEWCL